MIGSSAQGQRRPSSSATGRGSVGTAARPATAASSLPADRKVAAADSRPATAAAGASSTGISKTLAELLLEHRFDGASSAAAGAGGKGKLDPKDVPVAVDMYMVEATGNLQTECT